MSTTGLSAVSEDDDIIYGVRKLSPPDLLHASYIGGGTLLRAYYRTLNCSEDEVVNHDGLFDPGPSEDIRIELFSQFLQNDGFTEHMTRQSRQILFDISLSCYDRSFITTQEGYIGLGPRFARPNDEIWVVIGCHVPLVLRPTLKSRKIQYQVIREIYASGVMNGEALFGQVPERFQPVLRYDKDVGGGVPSFLDSQTGLCTDEDPRLARFRATTSAQDDAKQPSSKTFEVAAAELSDIGVDLKQIELI